MSRYIPTASEQVAIDKLRLAGYVVVRAKTYDAMLERKRIAECVAQMETERREGVERWARGCCDEERRLTQRLNEVCFAATALGVPIDAINKALDKAAS